MKNKNTLIFGGRGVALRNFVECECISHESKRDKLIDHNVASRQHKNYLIS